MADYNTPDVYVRSANMDEPAGTYNIKPVSVNARDYFEVSFTAIDSFNVDERRLNYLLLDMKRQRLRVSVSDELVYRREMGI